MERRLDADGEPYTREEWLEYYGDVEGAERWSDALPAKAVASELGVWPSDDEDVLPPAKHRSRASKGYCEAATIDIIAEDDGKGAPRRKKAPGRPKKTTPRRIQRASVPVPAERSTEQVSGPSCGAIELALAVYMV